MEGLFETVWVPQNSRFVNNTHSTLDCRWSYRQPSVIANVCCVFCFSKSQIWIWKMFEVLQTHVNQKKLFSWFLQLIFFFFLFFRHIDDLNSNYTWPLSLVMMFSKWCFWSPGSRPLNAFHLVYLLKKTFTSAKNIKNTLTVHQPGFPDDEMIKLKAAALILIYFSLFLVNVFNNLKRDYKFCVWEGFAVPAFEIQLFIAGFCLICFHKQIWISAATKALFSVICMFKKINQKSVNSEGDASNFFCWPPRV